MSDTASAPTAPPPSPAALEEFAIELATGAAEVVRGAGGGRLLVDAKSTETDLVTQVDKASERWLRDRITARRPDDAVLGEEGGAAEGSSAVRWLLDPIDGTVNFVLGLPQYAVSVAAEVDGQVVAGAVCNPVTGELFHAHFGGGAFLGERPLTGPRDVPLSRAVLGTGFAYAAQTRARQVAVVAALLPEIADIRRLGSAALDLCAVAAGRLDGYFESGLNAWDYAAGMLIATEAGCGADGPGGRPPGRELVVVAGPGLIGPLTETLRELGRAS